jgi:Lon protease-like protein
MPSKHIFEERYKLMIGLCTNDNKPFGVVLVRKGRAEHDVLAEPFAVGCTAQITRVEPLAQGRMNIVAVGRERFRIVSLNRDKPYLVGMVEPFPLDDLNHASIGESTAQLKRLIERFLEIMKDTGQLRFKSRQELPRDPLALAYLAAVLLTIPPVQQQALLGQVISADRPAHRSLATFQSFVAQQQALLESAQAATLVADLCTIYRREVALLDSMIGVHGEGESSRSFSDN